MQNQDPGLINPDGTQGNPSARSERDKPGQTQPNFAQTQTPPYGKQGAVSAYTVPPQGTQAAPNKVAAQGRGAKKAGGAKQVNGKRKRNWMWLLWVLFAIVLVSFAVFMGGMTGYQAAGQQKQATATSMAVLTVKEQFDLGVQDLEAGRYEVARQRFEYVLTQDPGYPGATEKLAAAVQVLYATATPTQVPPTITPTPTRDMRPVEDLFNQAKSAIANGDWGTGIDTIIGLRQADRTYRVTEVDGLLYLALRNRGVDKILKQNSLEGGIYDLALAEKFAPLDVQASNTRNWARLYMFGSSFWQAYPEQAVYYFSQVAAAAPYLQDGSGWTARERYRAVLIQYGDQLGQNGDWCKAQEQYELAQNIRPANDIQATANAAAINCAPPTSPPEPATEVPTLIPTASATTAVIVPPTEQPTAQPQITDTQAPPASDTPVPPTEPPTAEPPTPTVPEASPTSPPPTEAVTEPPPADTVTDQPTVEAVSSDTPPPAQVAVPLKPSGDPPVMPVLTTPLSDGFPAFQWQGKR